MAALCLLLSVVGLSILTTEAGIPWYPDIQPVPVNPVHPVHPVYPVIPFHPVHPVHPVHLVNPVYPGYPLLPTFRSISKCNSNVMNAIKSNFWSVYGCPRNIISNSINNGKEIVWKTTSGYYPDQPYCVYSCFFQEYFTIFKVKSSGIGLSSTTDKVNIIEVEGTLYDPDTNLLRVIIMVHNGVSLVYTCSLADDALDGPADGLIKYREVNSDLNFAYFQAPQLMASIGIQLTDEYALTC